MLFRSTGLRQDLCSLQIRANLGYSIRESTVSSVTRFVPITSSSSGLQHGVLVAQGAIGVRILGTHRIVATGVNLLSYIYARDTGQ